MQISNSSQVNQYPEANKQEINANMKVKEKVTSILENKIKDIFWVPHPRFEKNHLELFPANAANFMKVTGAIKVGKIMEIIGKDGIKLYEDYWYNADKTDAIGSNTFFHWLNNESNMIEPENFVEPEKLCFMNCTDFVFTVLYQAGLITKEKVQSIYKKQIENAVNHS